MMYYRLQAPLVILSCALINRLFGYGLYEASALAGGYWCEAGQLPAEESPRILAESHLRAGAFGCICFVVIRIAHGVPCLGGKLYGEEIARR